MGVLNDTWIKEMVESHNMIEPFEGEQVKGGVSYGLSSYGYDMRISNRFKFYEGRNSVGIITRVLDPKLDNSSLFREIVREEIVLNPNSFVLAETVEYFRIPRNVLTIVVGKSTYARLGVGVTITPFEPEWEGTATIQIFNAGHSPVKVYGNEGIAQLIFLHADQGSCEVSYKDRQGQYQGQQGIRLPSEGLGK